MTIIVSGGRPRNVGAKAYPFPSRSTTTVGSTQNIVSLLRGDGLTYSYEGVFRSQPMLHAVVMKLVYGIARNPLKSYSGADVDTRERDRTSTLAQLIRRPYPFGSEFQLKAHLALDAHVHGHALAVKVRERGAGSTPAELWPVPWRHVQVVRDDHQNILGYNVVVGSEPISVGREEVVHISLPGGSPIESLRSTLALEDAAQTYQAENVRNGITPRAAFTTDQRLGENVIPRLREELSKLYAGSENAGKAMILDQGLKPERLGVTPVDMDLISQRKLSREEVCAAYDVAPTLLGLERGTYASVGEYRKALFDAIATKLVLIEDALNVQLVDPEPSWDGLFLEFDTNELLRPDPEARARMHMLTQQASTTTINERRRYENLPALDDPVADTVFMPVNMLPVGVAPMVTEADAGGTSDQGATDPAFLVQSITDALVNMPAPVVNLTVPEVASRTKRVERDDQGNIVRIIEE
jgi:HK97 family phage portal protein